MEYSEEFDATKQRYRDAKASGNLNDEQERKNAEMYMADDQNGEFRTQSINDRLFIETGEDVEDIFTAFKIYKLPNF